MNLSPPPIHIYDHVGLSATERLVIEGMIARHTLLERAARWAFGEGLLVEEPRAMDEFSLDVPVRLSEDRWLVYDST
ncbi:hypothetical protein L6R49_09650 [Myxococcota bacterium]|nr:hypothetical protein [Myxococcota bacterium]